MSIFKSFPVHVTMALIIAYGAIWYQTQEYDPQMRTGDSYIYLSTAKDLVDKGVLTNGVFGVAFPAKGKNGEGMFFTPIYPAFLSVIMRVDPTFYENATCHVASKNAKEAAKCGNDYSNVILVQTIIAALTAFFIWLTAYLLTKNLALSWLSFSIGVLSGVYGQYATEIMTEVLLFPLFTLGSLFAALAWKHKENIKQSGWAWLISGIIFGLATLTRPAYSYLIYCAGLFLFIALLFITKDGLKKALRFPILLFIGFAIIIIPWIIRNGTAIGNYGISEGYAPYILVQRLAYNDMSWAEWGASFVYRLPDFGDKLADKLFGEKTYERFDYDNPEGFFSVGHTKFRQQMTEEAGGYNNVMSHALKEYLIPNLPKHTIVTLSMAFNGIWINKYWSLAVLPLFFGTLFMAYRRKWTEFIILSFPGWFMVGFHGFTSVNVTRYNMTLVPCLSLGAAWILMLLFYWIKNRFITK